MKKITKEDIQKIIREETVKLLKEGLPSTSGQVKINPRIPMTVSVDGDFNLDVLIEGRSNSMSGKLSDTSIEVLVEYGILPEAALRGLDAPAADVAATSVGGPDPVRPSTLWDELDEGNLDDQPIEEVFGAIKRGVMGAIGKPGTKQDEKILQLKTKVDKKYPGIENIKGETISDKIKVPMSRDEYEQFRGLFGKLGKGSRDKITDKFRNIAAAYVNKVYHYFMASEKIGDTSDVVRRLSRRHPRNLGRRQFDGDKREKARHAAAAEMRKNIYQKGSQSTKGQIRRGY